jgi:hypothetical protein
LTGFRIKSSSSSNTKLVSKRALGLDVLKALFLLDLRGLNSFK